MVLSPRDLELSDSFQELLSIALLEVIPDGLQDTVESVRHHRLEFARVDLQ